MEKHRREEGRKEGERREACKITDGQAETPAMSALRTL